MIIARRTLNRITGQSRYYIDGQRVTGGDFRFALSTRQCDGGEVTHKGDLDRATYRLGDPA